MNIRGRTRPPSQRLFGSVRGGFESQWSRKAAGTWHSHRARRGRGERFAEQRWRLR